MFKTHRDLFPASPIGTILILSICAGAFGLLALFFRSNKGLMPTRHVSTETTNDR
jgi:hypothetical protein